VACLNPGMAAHMQPWQCRNAAHDELSEQAPSCLGSCCRSCSRWAL
jgi:hypothetical protein